MQDRRIDSNHDDSVLPLKAAIVARRFAQGETPTQIANNFDVKWAAEAYVTTWSRSPSSRRQPSAHRCHGVATTARTNQDRRQTPPPQTLEEPESVDLQVFREG